MKKRLVTCILYILLHKKDTTGYEPMTKTLDQKVWKVQHRPITTQDEDIRMGDTAEG